MWNRLNENTEYVVFRTALDTDLVELPTWEQIEPAFQYFIERAKADGFTVLDSLSDRNCEGHEQLSNEQAIEIAIGQGRITDLVEGYLGDFASSPYEVRLVINIEDGRQVDCDNETADNIWFNTDVFCFVLVRLKDKKDNIHFKLTKV